MNTALAQNSQVTPSRPADAVPDNSGEMLHGAEKIVELANYINKQALKPATTAEKPTMANTNGDQFPALEEKTNVQFASPIIAPHKERIQILEKWEGVVTSVDPVRLTFNASLTSIINNKPMLDAELSFGDIAFPLIVNLEHG